MEDTTNTSVKSFSESSKSEKSMEPKLEMSSLKSLSNSFVKRTQSKNWLKKLSSNPTVGKDWWGSIKVHSLSPQFSTNLLLIPHKNTWINFSILNSPNRAPHSPNFKKLKFNRNTNIQKTNLERRKVKMHSLEDRLPHTETNKKDSNTLKSTLFSHHPQLTPTSISFGTT